MIFCHFKTVKYANQTLFQIGLLACFASMMFVSVAHSYEFTKDFFLPSSVELDSNVEMAEKNKSSLWRYTMTPRLRLTAEEDRNSYFLDGALRLQRSSDKSRSQDREDPVLDGGWNHVYGLGQFGVTAHYEENSTRVAEFVRSGSVARDGSSINRSINGNWSHLLSDKLTFSSGLGFSKTKYSGVNLAGFSSKNISGKLSYEYSPFISPFVQLAFSDFKDDKIGDRSNSKSIMAGAMVKVNPQLNYSFSLGTNRISTGGNGWVAASALNFQATEKSLLSASYSRNVTASGLGGFQTSDDIGVSYVFSLNDKAQLGSDFSWSKNRSINDADAKQITGWYSRELNLDWSLRSNIQYRTLDGSNQSANAYQLGLSLIYNKLNF